MTHQTIGRYQVTGEVGRGGMATVYRATDPRFDREVAIKVLPCEYLHDTQLRARFEREAKTVAMLEHAAIVPVYDFGEEGGQPYIVMRFMAGGSLADRIQQGPLPIPEIVKIFNRLAPALDAAHARGIIHRDLKPGNILFDQYGDAYISDFGIARLAQNSGATLTGTAILGTPAYMSPEQVQGDKELDGHSDIYSLGVILFEMLTGIIPYRADTPAKVMMMHLLEPVPQVVSHNADIPYAFDEIIKQAMAKRKFARYNNSSEMAQAITIAAQGGMLPAAPTLQRLPSEDLPRGAGPRTPRERPVTPTPRHTPIPGSDLPAQGNTPVPSIPESKRKPQNRWLAWSIVVVVIAAVAIGGFFLAPGFFSSKVAYTSPTALAQNIDTATPTIKPTDNPTETQPPSTPTPTNTDLPTVTPSGTPEPTQPPTETSMVVSDASETPSIPTAISLPSIGGADQLAFLRSNDVWIANIDGTNPKRLTNTGGTKSDLQWAPDGQWVNFIAGRCVQSVNIDTQQVKTLMCTNWADYLAAFVISPDGAQVAISLSDGLFILPYVIQTLLNIKRQDQLKAAQTCIFYNAVPTKDILWSHDGKRIAMVIESTNLGRTEEMIRVMDIIACGQALVRVDEFPGARFTPTGYSNEPAIQSFGWDGDMVFALNIDFRNTYGDMWTYSMSTQAGKQLNPVDKQCCYRDFRWSPDGQYLLFAFEDVRYMSEVLLYYIEFGILDTSPNLTPIPFDQGFFSSKDKPQTALRPVK